PDARPVDGGVLAEDAKGAAGGRRHAPDHPHRRGLPGAVRAEEAEELAAVHVEVVAVDRGERAEVLGQPARMDENLRRGHAEPTVPTPCPRPAGDCAPRGRTAAAPG